MRYLSFIFLPLVCCLGYSEEPPMAGQPEFPSSSLSYDEQIKMLKQEIAKYESLALQFDRRASRLQDRDFTEYRRSLMWRQECEGIAKDLKKHLNEIEQEQKDSK